MPATPTNSTKTPCRRTASAQNDSGAEGAYAFARSVSERVRGNAAESRIRQVQAALAGRHDAAPVNDGNELAGRVKTLLELAMRSSAEATSVLNAIRSVGRTALFGGAVRDLALARPSAFRSDLDLVVSTDDPTALGEALYPFGGIRNRFGGYRLRAGHWRFDVWPLSATWAFSAGHVSSQGGFRALPHTTFFTWDAVTYGLDSEILYSIREIDEYIAELREGVLELNLEANPNPAGNVARAVRSALHGRALLGPRLAEYVARALGSALQSQHDEADLRTRQCRLIKSGVFDQWRRASGGADRGVVDASALMASLSFVDFDSVARFYGALAAHVERHRELPFAYGPHQYELPL